MPIRDRFHTLLHGSAGMRRAARRPMVVERVEPRILHSADPASAFAGAATLSAQVEHRVLDTQPAAPAAASEVTQNEQAPTELVFVDPRTPDYQQLVNDIHSEAADGRHIEVMVLDAGSDGIAQITACLSGRQDIAAIHLISHGSDGTVQIGSSLLDAQTLTGYEAALRSWSAALAPGADLLIYGCDVAASQAGRSLVGELSRLTGAEVAASENATGSAALGGDWVLEYATGTIQARSAITDYMQGKWSGLLNVTTLQASQDGYIVASTGNNYGASPQLIVDKSGGGAGNQRALVQFDLSSLPTGATINSATLQLQATALGATMNVDVYQVLQAWTEGTANGTAGAANWIQSTPGTNWTTAGGTYNATPVATLNAGAVGQHSWDITSLVQAWVNGTQSNNGVLLGSPDAGGGTITYASREGVTAPQLVINYTNSAPTLGGANDLNTIAEDSVANSGTLVSALIAGKVTDLDPGALPGIAVTGADNANGSWQYSLDGGSTWNAFGTPSAATARLLAADANTYVRFVPNANFNGTVTNGLTFRAWDQTGGINGGTADTTSITSTVLDQFSAVSYNNNDGSAFWSAGWVDTDGNPSAGSITISGGQLNLATLLGSDSIYREANLSGATGATLSFSYNNQLGLLGTVSLQASNNGGASYTTLATFSNLSNTGTGNFSTDISAYMAANTRIRLVMNGTLLGGSLSADNVQIAYTTPPGGSTPFSAATASSSIVVTEVNDAPSVSVPTAQTVATNGQLVFSSAGANAIVIGDVDAGSGTELVSLSVTNGTLTLASTAGLTFSAGTGTADASMSFSGTLAAINAALDGMRFDPAAGFYGAAGLGIAVNDQGNTGAGGAQSATGAVGITVQYSAPTISSAGTALNYTENDPATPIDTGLTLTAGTLGNLVGATVQLTANYANGQDVLAFTNQLGISGSWDASTGKLSLSGSATLADYQAALRSVTYQNGSDDPSTANRSVTFTIDDGIGTQASSRQVAVAAVNDAPALVAPVSIAVTEDVASALTGLSFGDVDAGSASVLATFSVAQGTLAAVSGGGVTVGGSATALTLSGSIADINAFIAASGLSYTTAANDTSTVTLGVSIDDLGNSGAGGALSTAASVTLAVTAVNDAPMGTNTTVSTAEDTPYVFSTIDFGFSDPNDTPANALLAVKITTLPGAGTLSLSGSAVAAGQFISATDITAGKLAFTPAPDASGSGYASFTFQVQDDGGVANGGIDLDPVARTMTLDVTAVNDAPTALVPGAQSTTSGSTLVFSAALGNALSVADPDAGAAAVQVTLSTTNGTLSLSGTAGLTFISGTGSGDAAMIFSAPIPAINSALDGLAFTPGAGFNGAALLSVAVNDQGNTGAGGAQSANATVAIAVLPPVAAGVPSPGVPSIPGAPSAPGSAVELPAAGTPALPDAPLPVGSAVVPDSASATPVRDANPAQSPGRIEEPAAVVDATSGAVAPGQNAAPAVQTEPSRTTARLSAGAFGGRDLRLLLATAQTPEVALANFALTGRDSPYANQIALASLHSTELLNELDRLRDGLQEEAKGEAHAIALSTAATLGLSVGYVFWLLRGGVFLSTVLSSMPAWRMIDPLPILGRLDDDADEQGGPDESLESLVARKNRSAGAAPQPVTP